MNIDTFVNETISKLENFDCENVECIKKVVRKSIEFYKLHSYEEVEETHLGTIQFLHLHSIIEENLLSKIVEISMRGDDLDIEGIYKGYVIRHY